MAVTKSLRLSARVAVVAFASCGGLPVITRADVTASPMPQPSKWLDHVQAHAELGLSGRADDASRLWVLSPVLGLDYRFSHGFGVRIDWPLLLAAEVPDLQSSQWVLGQGDPMLGVWYETSSASRDQVRIFAGLSVPAAWLPRSIVSRGLARTGYAFAAATRGLWNAWLWVPEQMALALGASWRRELYPHLQLKVEAGGAGSASLSWLTSDVGALYAQLAPAIELRAGTLRVGLRVQGVVIAPQSDPLQLSSGVYVGVGAEHWTVQADALCNLDEPLGLFGTGLSVCGMWLSMSASP